MRAVSGIPCFLFALEREHVEFRKRIVGLTSIGDRMWRGRGRTGEFLLIETGLGAENVQRAFGHLEKPSWLVFAGFAGSLVSELAVGSVFAASRVLSEKASFTPPMPLVLPSAPLFTSATMVGDPRAKRELHRVSGASAVDMESAAFAAECQRRGWRWACVRAISDDVDTALSPELGSLLAGGRPRTESVLGGLVRRPCMFWELLRLARDTRLASRNLAEALLPLT